MLQTADSFTASDCQDASELISPKAGEPRQRLSRIPPDKSSDGPVTGRYGDHRGFNVRALCLTISLHVLAVGLLLGVGNHVAQPEEARLIAINLSPPPPPPAESSSQPEPKTPAVSAPPPLLKITPHRESHAPVALDPQPAPPSPEPAKVFLASSAPAAAAATSVVHGGDLGTRMVAGKPPRYPLESRRRKEQGTVVLSLILGPDGAVEHISLSRSSGFARLDDAALDAVRKWRWEPLMRGGHPVKVEGIVEIPFVLKR